MAAGQAEPLLFLTMTSKEHYSAKGGHLARSEYWKEIRRQHPEAEYLARKTPTLLIRRNMRRITKDNR